MPTVAQTTLASGLRISVMRLARRMRAERGDTGLSVSQIAALATLDRHGALTPGELAAHEKVRPPSMTRILASLEAEGYAVREPHPTDRRQVVVRCTPAGVALLRDDRRRRDEWLARRLAELDPADHEVLRAALPVLDRLAGG